MAHFYQSKLRFLHLLLCLYFPITLYGQNLTNYVANTANSVTPGYQNTFVGPFTGNSSMTGAYNTFLGVQAGASSTAGEANIFVGARTGYNNTYGSYNTFLGYRVGYGNSTGSYNISIGYATGINTRTGSQNIFLGAQAGVGNWYGWDNVAVGTRAAYSINNTNYNVMIGDSSGFNYTAANSLFIGSKAGFKNVKGIGNTLLGYQSGYNTVADSNTFVGYQSGYTTTTGSGNTFFGAASGRNNTTGSHNTFVGNGAGPTSNNTNDNVYIGYSTGNHDSGSRNTFLGTGADATTQHLVNATAIGAGAEVAVSNAVILGNRANVGIGTSTPATRLEVNSDAESESGIRLTQLTAKSPALRQTDKFLSLNERGDVVLARYQLQYASPTEWSDNVFSPAYSLKSLREVSQYITVHRHLPGIPSAAEVVEHGIDAAIMNAKLLEKIEELTLYSIQLEKHGHQQAQRIQSLEQRQAQLEKMLQELLDRKK